VSDVVVDWQVRGVLIVRWAPLFTSHTFKIGAYWDCSARGPCPRCLLKSFRGVRVLTCLGALMHTGPRDDELEHSLGLLHHAVLAATKRIHQDTSLKEDMGGLESQLQQHRALDALVERMHGFSLLRARPPPVFCLIIRSWVPDRHHVCQEVANSCIPIKML
jgi:hypothetical protein